MVETVDQPKEKDTYVNTSEAGRLLGVSPRTVHYWIDKGYLKSWKTAGGHRRISLASINAQLKKQQVNLHDGGAKELTLLIVEDDSVFVDVYLGAIKSWGYPLRVVLADNGFQGLIRLGEEQPDVVITDLKMPAMDGFKMVRTITSTADYGDILLIAITSLSQQEIAERGGLPAGVEVFYKPPPMSRIRALIQEKGGFAF
ncbi:MAG: response regulator [Magnetococcales bacterium]|nr:response regulator [Magnetococcales bacterium]